LKKRSRKLISILLTLSLLVTLLVPLAAPAAAASATYTAVTTPVVSDDGNTALGKAKAEFSVSDVTYDAVAGGDSVFFKLPNDFTLFPDTVTDANGNGRIINDEVRVNQEDANTWTIELAAVPNTNYVSISTPTVSNAIRSADILVTLISDNEFKVEYRGTVSDVTQDTGIFMMDFQSVYVPSYDGDIKLSIDAPSDSSFGDGSVVIGQTSGGEVTVSVKDTQTSNSDFEVTLRIEENTTGAFENEADSLKFILPDGYEWSTPAVTGGPTRIWGDDNVASYTFTPDQDELSFDPNSASTLKASCFEVTLAFEVTDEEDVAEGDITMKIRGESDVNPTELVVGAYGDYNARAYAVDEDELPTVYTGKVEQEISNIMVEEAIASSLIENRYIKFELPAFARWTSVPNLVNNNGVILDFDGIAGSEGNVVKYTVRNGTGSTTSEAELEFKDMEVMLDVTAPGDLKVKVSGNNGVEGEFAVAKMATSVTAKSDSKPEIRIGVAGQKIGDITITEAEAGSIEDGKILMLKVPNGTEWAKLPKVEVVSGDLDLDITGMSRSKDKNDFYQFVRIPVDNDSNEASEIKISEIYVNVDRTVAEGDIKVAVLGNAVLESNGVPTSPTTWFDATAGTIAGGNYSANIDGVGGGEYSIMNSLFPGTTAYTAAAAAVVSTPAPGSYKANASFVIGSTTYKVGGVEMTMDVAPYVKDGRTFLPVRYVAQALGVADANILWDNASQKVTLIKDGTVVQLTIGSNVLLLNGAAITMDVAPELTSDRTMLPIRFIAQAFGATVGWDEATQTVTLN